jgi:hypothetical protein
VKGRAPGERLVRRETACLGHVEAENDRWLEGLSRKKQRTAEENRLAVLLTPLIEEYEERGYALPQAARAPSLKEFAVGDPATKILGRRSFAHEVL